MRAAASCRLPEVLRMAHVVDLAAMNDWVDLAEGEVRIVPLVQYDNGVRVRMLVSRREIGRAHV